MPIRRVNPGDPLRAEDFNALVDEVARLTRLLSAAGITGGLGIGEVQDVVTAVIVDAPPEGVPIMPGECTYTYVLFGGPDVGATGVIPWKGRPVISDGGADGIGEIGIYPRPVGERCWIHRIRNAEGVVEARLEVVTEAIAFGPCGGGEAMAGGGQPDDNAGKGLVIGGGGDGAGSVGDAGDGGQV